MAQFFNFKGDYFGLTESDVQKNIDLYGYNIYTKKEQPRERFNPGKVILSPSALLMFIAGVLSFFSSGILTGIVIILIDIAWCVANIRIGQRSDERLEEFHESTVMKYRVIRQGKLELVEKEFMILVQAGESVPADAMIQECRDLSVDESVFTGSNKPAAKYAGGISKSELKPTFVYSGTKILTGVAVCKVSATGVDTKYSEALLLHYDGAYNSEAASALFCDGGCPGAHLNGCMDTLRQRGVRICNARYHARTLFPSGGYRHDHKNLLHKMRLRNVREKRGSKIAVRYRKAEFHVSAVR